MHEVPATAGPSAGPTAPSPSPVQVGPWSSFRALLRWSLASIGAMLPLIVVIQAALAAAPKTAADSAEKGGAR